MLSIEATDSSFELQNDSLTAFTAKCSDGREEPDV
jgi:hypothetical protein